jgi:hypothetical protein
MRGWGIGEGVGWALGFQGDSGNADRRALIGLKSLSPSVSNRVKPGFRRQTGFNPDLGR